MKVIGGSAFSGCTALTTVNLSQVTWINLNALGGIECAISVMTVSVVKNGGALYTAATITYVHLLFTTTGVTSIAQGAGGYQLTQADCDRLKVDPESMVSLYGEPHQKYGDNFELYLDPGAEHQIKLRLKNFTPPTSGNIDMTSMTADEAQLTILAALAAGFTEIKLTGSVTS